MRLLEKNLDHEYAGITGVPAFTKAAATLAYGAASPVLNNIAITQSISGTGALRIAGAFLERFYPHTKTVYLPTPSWANHGAIFRDCGLNVKGYSYYNKETISLDIDGLLRDIKDAPSSSVLLLRRCLLPNASPPRPRTPLNPPPLKLPKP